MFTWVLTDCGPPWVTSPWENLDRYLHHSIVTEHNHKTFIWDQPVNKTSIETNPWMQHFLYKNRLKKSPGYCKQFITAIWEARVAHETLAVLLPGFTIKLTAKQVTRQPHLHELSIFYKTLLACQLLSMAPLEYTGSMSSTLKMARPTWLMSQIHNSGRMTLKKSLVATTPAMHRSTKVWSSSIWKEQNRETAALETFSVSLLITSRNRLNFCLLTGWGGVTLIGVQGPVLLIMLKSLLVNMDFLT